MSMVSVMATTDPFSRYDFGHSQNFSQHFYEPWHDRSYCERIQLATYARYRPLHPQTSLVQHHIHAPQIRLADPWTHQRIYYPPPPYQASLNSPQATARPVEQTPALTIVPDAPRGPPRKPKQSGHAVWIGNLPNNTSIYDVKEYFSQVAKDDIESVFLISKSNCAFANFINHAACERTITWIQSSSFQGRRLVCRLRMHQAPGSPSSTSSSTLSSLSRTGTSDSSQGPATPPSEDQGSPVIVRSESTEETDAEVLSKTTSLKSDLGRSSVSPRVPERYFIIKSLTVPDLVASVNKKSWEAQSHMEAILEDAFKSADNVYLIFSANKSGEYFGIARMSSNMYEKRDEATSGVTGATAEGPISTHPQHIVTTETETAPRGRIHDDSTRGTMFWEADRHVAQNDKDEAGEQKVVSRKQFDVEWLSTLRVPFYRTRGLRNPWNGFKEVKIARDGTELEPNVGRLLAQSFR